MKTDMKRKMYMGIWRFMLPLPLAISAKGAKSGLSGAKTKLDGNLNIISVDEGSEPMFCVALMNTD